MKITLSELKHIIKEEIRKENLKSERIDEAAWGSFFKNLAKKAVNVFKKDDKKKSTSKDPLPGIDLTPPLPKENPTYQKIDPVPLEKKEVIQLKKEFSKDKIYKRIAEVIDIGNDTYLKTYGLDLSKDKLVFKEGTLITGCESLYKTLLSCVENKEQSGKKQIGIFTAYLDDVNIGKVMVNGDGLYNFIDARYAPEFWSLHANQMETQIKEKSPLGSTPQSMQTSFIAVGQDTRKYFNFLLNRIHDIIEEEIIEVFQDNHDKPKVSYSRQ